jgi:hypothetical protein
MLIEIIGRVIAELIGKLVGFLWERGIHINYHSVHSDWDKNIGDYIAGKSGPIIKDKIDINKWNNS